MHKFTQDFNNALRGKQSNEELQDNKEKASNSIKQMMSVISSNYNAPGNQYKLNNLNKVLNVVNNADKRIVYGQNVKGDKFFIAQPSFGNNKGMNIIVVDFKHGSVKGIEPGSDIKLGSLQNEESADIAEMYAPAFNKNATGYDTKNVRYTK